jgi:DNA polymerase-3 subunit delta'
MKVLSTKLCPWLAGPLADLDQAVQADRLGHGWIFAGPAGTGKLNLALVFAERLLRPDGSMGIPPALAPSEMLAALESRHMPQDHHPDLHLVGPEEGKRSIGIDRVREVIGSVALTGFAGERKVVVIEPAEWMTGSAANALLKSLEEPTTGTHLILVSHCIGRLPATIRSRCQTLHVRRPAAAAQRAWLELAELDPTHPLLSGSGVSPAQAAARIHIENIKEYNKIDEYIDLIYDDAIAVSSAVDAWRALDVALTLEWMDERIRGVIRGRVGLRDRNSITDDDRRLPQNRWPRLPTDRLFLILEQVGQLRDLLGTGLNETLALEGVLSRFSPG